MAFLNYTGEVKGRREEVSSVDISPDTPPQLWPGGECISAALVQNSSVVIQNSRVVQYCSTVLQYSSACSIALRIVVQSNVQQIIVLRQELCTTVYIAVQE